MKIHITRQAGVSLTRLIDRIAAALREQFKRSGEPIYWYPDEVFDDSVIVCDSTEAKNYRIPYTDDGEKVTFGEPLEVREEYVPVGDASQTEEVMQGMGRIRQSLDPEGWKWRFQVVGWGLSVTRHVWRREVFAQSLRDYKWENLKAFADHATEEELRKQPERKIRELVGWWSDFEITDQGMDGTLNIKPSADWLCQDLKATFEAGLRDFYGASIFVGIQVKQVTWTDSKPANEATAVKPISIDIVTDAAAKGYVKYALASNRGRQTSEGAMTMNKKALALLFRQSNQRFEFVRQSLVTASAKGVTAEQTEEQLAEAIHGDEALVDQAVTLFETEPAPATPTGQAARPASDSPVTWQQMPAELREMMINQALQTSNLPEAVQQAIRRRVGADATLEGVQAQIVISRETLATVSQAGLFNNPRPEVIAESRDKRTIAMAKTFGLTRETFLGVETPVEREVRQSGGQPFQPPQDLWNTIPPVQSLRQFYIEMTGDTELTGQPPQNSRLTRQATWLSSDFPQLMAAVVGKRLVMDYRENDFGIDRVITVKPVFDFKTQRAVKVGYFGDLPAVSEDGTYLETSVLADSEETYAITKRGRVVSLSIEAIANDDLTAYVRYIQRLGRAARRTLAKFVWNTCIFGNPTMGEDSLALFHASHNNLISVALGSDSLETACNVLLTQSEYGSNETLILSTNDLTLAVPGGIFLRANALTDFNNEPGGNQDPLAQTIRRLGIKLVNLGNLTGDPNDWGLFASKADLDLVEIGFFQGRQEPEVFMQTDPTQGDSFGKDKVWAAKIRHIYSGTPIDWRGMLKSAVVNS
jgi:hypothetical protein